MLAFRGWQMQEVEASILRVQGCLLGITFTRIGRDVLGIREGGKDLSTEANVVMRARLEGDARG